MHKMYYNPQNPDNIFDNYLLLPPETRMHIVDSMNVADRVRYTRCSKLSRAEAQRSKNFMYGLEFCVVREENARIHFLYEDDQNLKEDEVGCGFILEFAIENGWKYMRYLDLGFNELWKIQLCISTDLVQFAAENFRKVLKITHNMIRKLTISHGPYFRNELQNFDFEPEVLNNLQVLEMHSDDDIQQFLSRLRRPLKQLSVMGKRNNEHLANYKLCTVRDYLGVPFFEMNYQQFLQLSASTVRAKIGSITEMDIFDYIKLWKKGGTGKKVERYDWRLEDANFDISKLLRLMGEKKPESEESVTLFIEHELEEGRKAVLSYGHSCLTFDTDPTSDWSDPTSEDERDVMNGLDNDE